MLPTPEPDLGNASGGKSLIAFYIARKRPLRIFAACGFLAFASRYCVRAPLIEVPTAQGNGNRGGDWVPERCGRSAAP